MTTKKEDLLFTEGTKVYTVSEITRDVRFILDEHFADVWIEGEISNFKTYPSGHSYFSLKDKNSLLKCVLFKNSSGNLKFDVEDGMHVLCRGRVSFYEKSGQCQLYVEVVEPRGKGALQLAFEKLKKKLYEEGLFSEEHKKPLPFLPMRVGVVTSSAGAAIRDILKVARRRFSNVEISIRPVRVQGDEAKGEIADAIKELNEYNEVLAKEEKDAHPIDIIIVGRGGGSLEDLWPFNEEVVARAIFDSEIPVISAVGHEVDYTISDFVADFRAATPSAAAELVMPLKEELVGKINKLRARAYQAIKSRRDRLESDVTALKNSYVLKAPMNVFLQMGQEVDELVRSLANNVTGIVKTKRSSLGALAGKLEALSPLAVLSRGYSITFKEGKPVKSSQGLKKGDEIETRLGEGTLTSKVETVKSK